MTAFEPAPKCPTAATTQRAICNFEIKPAVPCTHGGPECARSRAELTLLPAVCASAHIVANCPPLCLAEKHGSQ
jgi:hypothetical protein